MPTIPQVPSQLQSPSGGYWTTLYRWLVKLIAAIVSFISGSITVSATAAAIEALPGPAITSPRTCWVEEFQAFYVFVPGSVAVVDHFTVLGVTGGVAGRWLLNGNAIGITPLGTLTPIVYAPVGGGGDDGAALTALIAKGFRWFRLVPGGAYNFATMVLLVDNVRIDGAPGATLTSTNATPLPGYGVAPYIVAIFGYYQGPGNSGLNFTTLTAPSVIGTNTVTVADRSQIVNGGWFVLDDFGNRVTPPYKVLAGGGLAGPGVITLDRKVWWVFDAGSGAAMRTPVQDVQLYGNGATFTGTIAGRYVDIFCARDSVIDGWNVVANGGGESAISFDAGAFGCDMTNNHVDGAGGAGPNGTTMETSEQCFSQGNTAIHLTGYGHVFLDNVSTASIGNTAENCNVGLTVQSGGATDKYGAYGVSVIGCDLRGNTNGLQIVNSRDVEVVAVDCAFSSNIGIHVLRADAGLSYSGIVLDQCVMDDCGAYGLQVDTGGLDTVKVTACSMSRCTTAGATIAWQTKFRDCTFRDQLGQADIICQAGAYDAWVLDCQHSQAVDQIYQAVSIVTTGVVTVRGCTFKPPAAPAATTICVYQQVAGTVRMGSCVGQGKYGFYDITGTLYDEENNDFSTCTTAPWTVNLFKNQYNSVDVTLIGGAKTVASGLNLTKAKLVSVQLKTPNTATGQPATTFVAAANGNITMTSYGPTGAQVGGDASTYTVTFAGAN